MTAPDIEALLAKVEEGLVPVKPLEWRLIDPTGEADDSWLEAFTPFAPYTVSFVAHHKLPFLLEPFRADLDSNYASDDLAKAAAEADYAQRINSAVDSAALLALIKGVLGHE